MTLAGAVLAGGAGRRMGAVKPLVVVGGLPMGGRVAGALAEAGADPVTLVGAPAEVGTALGLPVVPDRWPGEGPLGGIATAVRWAGSRPDADLVVVVACDQVGVTPATVAALVAALGETPDTGAGRAAGAVVQTADGRRHPFPSVWRTATAEALAALVAVGERRADAAFALGVVAVARPDRELIDLDTPGDVARHHPSEGPGQPGS